MKGIYVDRLKKISDKKRSNILKRVVQKREREPDFLVFDDSLSKQNLTPLSLRHCDSDCAFMLADGSRLDTIHDLMASLEIMPDQVFEHHVNEAKNDFSAWVAGVFGEDTLAASLSESCCKKEHHSITTKHVVSDLANHVRRSL